MDTTHGFKHLTRGNWKRPDGIMRAFVQIRPDGTAGPISADEWAEAILAVSLADAVPEPVQALFKVARGAVLYGYFFYPLFTLGLEQVYRAADAAVAAKCKAMQAPKKLAFAKRVAWLTQQGVLTERDKETWDLIRHFRNAASHSERPTILTPGTSIGLMRQIAGEISRLFGERAS